MKIKLPVYGNNRPWCAELGVLNGNGRNPGWDFIQPTLCTEGDVVGPNELSGWMSYPIEPGKVYVLSYRDPKTSIHLRRTVCIESAGQEQDLVYDPTLDNVKLPVTGLRAMRRQSRSNVMAEMQARQGTRTKKEQAKDTVKELTTETQKIAQALLTAGDPRPYEEIVTALSDVAIRKMRRAAKKRHSELHRP